MSLTNIKQAADPVWQKQCVEGESRKAQMGREGADHSGRGKAQALWATGGTLAITDAGGSHRGFVQRHPLQSERPGRRHQWGQEQGGDHGGSKWTGCEDGSDQMC